MKASNNEKYGIPVVLGEARLRQERGVLMKASNNEKYGIPVVLGEARLRQDFDELFRIAAEAYSYEMESEGY